MSQVANAKAKKAPSTEITSVQIPSIMWFIRHQDVLNFFIDQKQLSTPHSSVRDIVRAGVEKLDQLLKYVGQTPNMKYLATLRDEIKTCEGIVEQFKADYVKSQKDVKSPKG